MTAQEKFERLKQYLGELGDVAVAFSGGVDSAFLLKTAHALLGDRVIAVTARSGSFPARELREATAFCADAGITQLLFDSAELAVPGFAENPPNRCYLCKKQILSQVWALAREHGFTQVAEGSNADDDGDYRPGRQAVAELGVLSPLRHVGLNKQEIRDLSRAMGLPTWNKPSLACLASRFPYGERITAARLALVEQAEQWLWDAGFQQVRVRYHQGLARIETDSEGFRLLADPALRARLYDAFRQIGFTYTALDLLGYRTGSLNETISQGTAEE